MNAKQEHTARVLLGEITGVHGIRGEVTVRSYTAAPEDIASYGPLYDETGARQIIIQSLRVTAKGVVAKLTGLNDRNAAEAARGTKLYVDRARLPDAGTDEFYLIDLVGLNAIAPDGTAVGRIVSVENFGAGDLLEIEPATGGHTRYVAFTKANVPNVDLAAGHLTLVLPPEDNGSEEGEADGSPENGDEDR